MSSIYPNLLQANGKKKKKTHTQKNNASLNVSICMKENLEMFCFCISWNSKNIKGFY